VRTRYRDGRQDELDGVTVAYGDLGDPTWWWFNLRASNTEPLLRLNLEASDAALAKAKQAELIGILGPPSEH
jgi:phosphomannomutase